MFFQEFQEEAEAVRNYVGALEELATRNMWAPPKYDEAQFQGKPNKRIFKVTCTLNGATATGYGRKKKEAKHHAAEQLLEQLLVEEPVPKKKKVE